MRRLIFYLLSGLLLASPASAADENPAGSTAGDHNPEIREEDRELIAELELMELLELLENLNALASMEDKE